MTLYSRPDLQVISTITSATGMIVLVKRSTRPLNAVWRGLISRFPSGVLSQSSIIGKLIPPGISHGSSTWTREPLPVWLIDWKGYLRRTPDMNDRRSVLLRLTGAGQPVVPELAAAVDSNDMAFYGGLNRDERHQYQAILGKLLRVAYISPPADWPSEEPA